MWLVGDDIPGQVVIDGRHRGPARSGNGGYVSGLVAVPLVGGTGAAARVTLHAPPPLDRPLDLVAEEALVRLRDGDVVVASAEPDDGTDLLTIDPVSYAEAARASASYPGHTFHPFPTCFACGTGNPDGLRIFPGPVAEADGRTRVAAPWVPPTDVDEAVVWAALDCVGGWAGDLTERLMVLGRMTASVAYVPAPGERCVAMGLDLDTEGRRTFTRSSIHTEDGRLVGRAAHVWVAVDPDRFNLESAQSARSSASL